MVSKRIRDHLWIAALAASLLPTEGFAATTLTIATVGNSDMVEMKKLTPEFEKANPDINVQWVVLEENVLRQKVTTDIATGSGQYDIVTIGLYETPLWAKRGWLLPLTDLPSDYDLNDIIPAARDGLTVDGKLYALPFNFGTQMTFYRKDLFEKAGLTMPDNPTWDQIKGFAKQLTDRSKDQYGMCMRGKPGWGENMATFSTMVNTFGGRWFDEKWVAQIDTPEWKDALTFTKELASESAPPGVTSNGFNENLALMLAGKCAIWTDNTVAAGFLMGDKESPYADKFGFAAAPYAKTVKGSQMVWAWSLAIPASTKSEEAAKRFVTWATSKEYIKLVAKDEGWASVPPGTRKSTYLYDEYQKAAPFANMVLKSLESADSKDFSVKPVPYSGVQFVSIPEFQGLGTEVGKNIAAALSGSLSVDAALKESDALANRIMVKAGYQK